MKRTEAGTTQRKSSDTVRVAILSDTHGFVDPRIAQIVARCDIAVHGGDIGCATILDALLPRDNLVLAVRGNNDVPQKWPANQRRALSVLPLEAAVDLPGGKLVVTHGDRTGPPQKRHERLRAAYPGARAVVYGHSHRLICDVGQVPWVLNPGSAGRSRTFGGPSCLVLSARKNKWTLRACRFSARQE